MKQQIRDLRPSDYAHGLCFVVFCCGLEMIDFAHIFQAYFWYDWPMAILHHWKLFINHHVKSLRPCDKTATKWSKPILCAYIWRHSVSIQISPWRSKQAPTSIVLSGHYISMVVFSKGQPCLTNLPLVPHIYASVNWDSIGSEIGLSSIWRPSIIRTNAEILLIELLGTNFSEILIEIQTFHSQKWIGKCHLRNGGHFVQGEMS